MKQITNILGVLITISVLTAGASSQSPSDNYVLARGQSLRLKFSPDQKIHVTNRGVVNLKDHGSSVTIVGVKTGYTSVVSDGRIFRITVTGVDTARSYLKLKKLTDDMKGLEVDATPKAASLRGELLRFSDWLNIAEAAKEENLEYTFESKISDDIVDRVQNHFRQILAQNELPPLRVSLNAPAQAIMPAELEARRAQYKNLFSPYGITLLKDTSSVALAPMVEVEILVAEVQRSFLRKFGISWPQELRAGLAPASGVVNFESLDFALQALEAKGAGRVLASPKLLCRSGKEAEFLAGGEFPIAVRHKMLSEVIWKKHGVILKIKPIADLSGRMSIDIETEVSMIQPRSRAEELPSLSTNRIKTHFDLEGSRTVALSGLLKSVEGRGRSGLPILSELPILGPLFSSRDYLEERTELVFFVTPKLVPFGSSNKSSPPLALPDWKPHDS